MTLSELIKQLQEIESYAGGLHVEIRNPAGDFDWVDKVRIQSDLPLELWTGINERNYVQITCEG